MRTHVTLHPEWPLKAIIHIGFVDTGAQVTCVLGVGAGIRWLAHYCRDAGDERNDYIEAVDFTVVGDQNLLVAFSAMLANDCVTGCP